MTTTSTHAPDPAAAPPLWDDLVSAALVGTDRRAVTPPGGGDPALGLLAQAAAEVTRQSVGLPPGPFHGTLPEPMPADPRPLAPDAAVIRLRSLLDSYPKYLPEWLAAVHAAGYRLPSAHFPRLLETGRTTMPMRQELAFVLGAQGRWLAARVSPWRYLLREARADSTEEDWRRPGDPEARVAYIAGLYLKDPEAARALIRETWPNERAQFKRHLLGVMQRHADPADLSFVEGLAKDPSKQVRDEAKLFAGSLRSRADKGEVPDFTRETARILEWRGVSRELHHFAMSRSGQPWPRNGARLLLDSIAAHSVRKAAGPDGAGPNGAGAGPGSGSGPLTASNAMNGWLIEQLLGVLADNAPVSLCGRVAEVVRDQSLRTLDGVEPTVDFTGLRTLLEYRRDMLAELSPPATGPTAESDPTTDPGTATETGRESR